MVAIIVAAIREFLARHPETNIVSIPVELRMTTILSLIVEIGFPIDAAIQIIVAVALSLFETFLILLMLPGAAFLFDRFAAF